MIRDNLLSYSSADIPWYTQTFTNGTVNSMVSSCLATLLSYQATAILFDVFLGLKKSKVAKIKSMAILMLTWKSSSPLGVINSIFREDWISRLYYKGDIPRDTRIARDKSPVRPITVVVVLILLFAAPCLDIVLVSLTLSRTTKLSFKKAGFSGIAFGLNFNVEKVETSPYIPLCESFNFLSRENDKVDARLYTCTSPILPEPLETEAVGFNVEVRNSTEIGVVVLLQGMKTRGRKSMELQTESSTYKVLPQLSDEDVQSLKQLSLNILREECEIVQEVEKELEKERGSQLDISSDTIFSFVASCESPKSDDSMETLKRATIFVETLLDRFTVVPSTDMLVLPLDSSDPSDVRSAMDDTMLSRTERNASLVILGIATIVVIIARILGGLVFSNDVADGLERTVKERLGFNYCDSLLRMARGHVLFREKFQEGERGHYGLHRDGMVDVHKFIGGTVGDL